MSSTMATAIVTTTTTTTEPVSQVKLCVNCLDRKKKEVEATDTFESVPMCKSCRNRWNDNCTYLSPDEWSAGWAPTLEYYQSLSCEKYGKPTKAEYVIVATLPSKPKTKYCESCYMMGKGPTVSTSCYSGVLMCDWCREYCEKHRKNKET